MRWKLAFRFDIYWIKSKTSQRTHFSTKFLSYLPTYVMVDHACDGDKIMIVLIKCKTALRQPVVQWKGDQLMTSCLLSCQQKLQSFIQIQCNKLATLFKICSYVCRDSYNFIMQAKAAGQAIVADKYEFLASYEYEGERTASRITEVIKENFLLPCWIQRYKVGHQYDKDHKENIIDENNINMLDCRSIKHSQQNKITLVQEDQQELDTFQSLRKQASTSPEASNYIEQANALSQKWKNFLTYVNNHPEYKGLNKNTGKFLKAYIFQRIYKCTKQQSEDDILAQEYILVSSPTPQKDKFKDQKNNTQLYSQYNTVFILNPQSSLVEQAKNLKISIHFGRNQLDYRRRVEYYTIPENCGVRALKLTITIKDQKLFFVKDLKAQTILQPQKTRKAQKISQGSACLNCFAGHSFYWEIAPIINRNRIIYPYQQSKFQRNKLTLDKHFHLAFQGGGAKGIAYVGAYKSIREQKDQGKMIPIKTIMGSSAGGIIALAISTGIPEYQLQKICYKMNNIPIQDSYRPEKGKQGKQVKQAETQDEFGNTITVSTIAENLKKLLDQFGIFKRNGIEEIIKLLTQEEGGIKLHSSLANWIKIVSPAMGDMITKTVDDEVPVGWLTKLSGAVWARRKGDQKFDKRFNFEGLLLHGAMMKGQAIHSIAKDCLVKFFLKERLFKGGDFKIFVNRGLEQYQQHSVLAKQSTENIIAQLNEYQRTSQNLLQTPLNQIYKFCQTDENFKKFLGGVLNRFIIVIDDYLQLNEQSNLIIFDPNYKWATNLSKFINRPAESQDQTQVTHLLDYFLRKLTKSQRQNTQKVIQEKKKHSISYSQLNSLLKKDNLIDPADINSDQLKNSKDSILTYVNRFFFRALPKARIVIQLPGERQTVSVYPPQQQKNFSIKDIFVSKRKLDTKSPEKDKVYEMNALFYRLEAQQIVVQICKYFNPDIDNLQKWDKIKNEQIKTVREYMDNLFTLREQVAKINMLQYYRLTNIELSCTSVDLDSKVLRFFNHKTTPQLPVCRSVQMTGSFPTAFKAQRWRQEWGKYNVYLLQKKMQIDITGHQFTDGGLLANFPIKYMDNELIRKRYFTQKSVPNQTILLGFGLDALEPSKYQLTQKQVDTQAKKSYESQYALAYLKDIFSEFNVALGKSLFFSTSGESGKSQFWSQLSHWLLNQIPLLRFGLKIASAYPNADRNLNLQAFENKVLVEQTLPEWQLTQQHRQTKKAEDRAFIKEFFAYYKTHLQNYYQSNAANPEDNVQKINDHLKDRIKDLNGRAQTIKKSFLNLVKEQGTFMFQNIFVKAQNKKLQQKVEQKPETQQQRQQRQQKFQANLAINLIKLLFIHLKIYKNKDVAQRFSRYYAYMKFVVQTLNQQQLGNQASFSLADNRVVYPELNEINFEHLFNEQSFEQISRHLAFEDYDKNLYKELVVQLRKKNGKSQQTFLKDKRKADKEVSRKPNGNKQSDLEFYDLQLFDVTDSVKRLTQLIFLMVKGRIDNKLNVQRVKKLTLHIKKVNYESLFRKSSHSTNQIDYQLTYIQIIDFLKAQISNFQKNRISFTLSNSFYTFLKSYDTKYDTRTELSSNSYRIYLSNIIYHYNSYQINLKNKQTNEALIRSVSKQQKQGTNKYLERQYKFIAKYKSNDEVRKSMIRSFVNNLKIQWKSEWHAFSDREHFPNIASRVVYKILTGKNITSVTKKEDIEQIKQLERFLIFLFTPELNKQVGKEGEITIQLEQEIVRHKEKALDSLTYLINRYFYPDDPTTSTKLSDETPLNFYKEITTLTQFQSGYSDKVLSGFDQQLHDILKSIKKDPTKNGCNYVDSYMLALLEVEAIHLSLQSKIQDKRQYNQLRLKEVEKLNKSVEQKKQLEKKGTGIGSKAISWMTPVEQKSAAQELAQNKNLLNLKVDRLAKLNKTYYYDISFFFSSLKEIIFLLYQMENKAAFNNLEEDRTPFDEIVAIYTKVLLEFSEKYYTLQQLAVNDINEEKLSCAFIISLEQINKLAHVYFQHISEKYHQVWIKLKNPNAVLSNDQKIIYYVYQILSKLLRHKFSLPLLNIDWKIAVQKISRMFKRNVVNILLLQVYPKNDTFDKKVKPKQQILQKYLAQSSEKNKKSRQIDANVHLIMEGVGSSNEYLGGLYTNIYQIFEDWKKSIEGIKVSQYDNHQHAPVYQQKIKAITSSNFQSLFGFFLSLNYDIEEIRKELYNLKFITNYMQDELKIKQHFNSLEWLNNTSYRENQLLKYLQIENTSIFDRLQIINGKDYDTRSLKTQYEEVRMIYEHEKFLIAQTEAHILDQISKIVTQTSEKQLSSKQALQIAKKFGYDYICKANQKHQFKLVSKQAFILYRYIIAKILDTFGSLVYGIICNSILSNFPLDINKQNGVIIAKGLILGRLISTFKLNQYIIRKLKQAKRNPNITLSQFYQNSERQIFLNFTVIDINRQRLTFLNKKTMPNMPLWAALIATSTVPFVHKFFQANKEWQSTDVSSFYQYFVSQFFKVEQDSNQKITEYMSGNFISSVPLELLTNNTIRSGIFDEEISKCNQFALCFNAPSTKASCVDLQVQQKYLNITVTEGLGILKSLIWPDKSSCDKAHLHENNQYNISYSLGQPFFKWLGNTTLMQTASILSNSNDNLILKWYKDKVIRLPIKVGTLDFDQIVEMPVLDKYLVNVLSEKAYETVERSYEITQSFIYNISNRIDKVPTIEPKIEQNRFKARFRVQIFEKNHEETGFSRKHFKLSFLNHSKWNQNRYDNFLIQYRVDEGTNFYSKNQPYKKAAESQIIWLVQSNTKIQLKFYYLLRDNEYVVIQPQIKKPEYYIVQTNAEIDFAPLVKNLPLQDSYDYELIFGWAHGYTPASIRQNPNSITLGSIKRNHFPFEDGPTIQVRFKFGEKEKIKTGKVIRKTQISRN